MRCKRDTKGACVFSVPFNKGGYRESVRRDRGTPIIASGLRSSHAGWWLFEPSCTQLLQQISAKVILIWCALARQRASKG